jgi:hypothetical protein
MTMTDEFFDAFSTTAILLNQPMSGILETSLLSYAKQQYEANMARLAMVKEGMIAPAEGKSTFEDLLKFFRAEAEKWKPLVDYAESIGFEEPTQFTSVKGGE